VLPPVTEGFNCLSGIPRGSSRYAESGALHRELEGFGGFHVSALATFVSPDGHQPRLVAGAIVKQLRIYDPEAGSVLHHLDGHTDSIADLACIASSSDAPHHPRLVSAFYRTAKVWDGETGGRLADLLVPGGPVRSVAVWGEHTGGHDRIAVAGYDGHIKVWDGETFTLLHDLDCGGGIARLLPFETAEGPARLMVSPQEAHRGLQVWDPEQGRLLHDGINHGCPLNNCHLLESAQGRHLLAIAGSGLNHTRHPGGTVRSFLSTCGTWGRPRLGQDTSGRPISRARARGRIIRPGLGHHVHEPTVVIPAGRKPSPVTRLSPHKLTKQPRFAPCLRRRRPTTQGAPAIASSTPPLALLLRRAHPNLRSRGLPQVPHIEEGPVRAAGVPNVLLSMAHDGQELPALCRLEHVAAGERAAAVDAVVQQAALLGVPHLHPPDPLEPQQQAGWPLHRLEGQHTSDIPRAAEVVEEAEGLAIPHPRLAIVGCRGDAVVPPRVLLPHRHARHRAPVLPQVRQHLPGLPVPHLGRVIKRTRDQAGVVRGGGRRRDARQALD
jgi:hypothetical protein